MGIKNKLESYIVEKLKKIDKNCRQTKASGASTEIADIKSNYFFVECKFRNTKNLTIDMKVWEKLLNEVPLHLVNKKPPFLAMENKDHKRFVIMDCEDFFNLLYKLYELGGLD